MNHDEQRIWLIKQLLAERSDVADVEIPAGALRINVAPFLLFRDSPLGIIYLQAVATV